MGNMVKMNLIKTCIAVQEELILDIGTLTKASKKRRWWQPVRRIRKQLAIPTSRPIEQMRPNPGTAFRNATSHARVTARTPMRMTLMRSRGCLTRGSHRL